VTLLDLDNVMCVIVSCTDFILLSLDLLSATLIVRRLGG
jgi:hypothetical protein